MSQTNIYHSLTELIGHTPLLELGHYAASIQAQATILAKL